MKPETRPAAFMNNSDNNNGINGNGNNNNNGQIQEQQPIQQQATVYPYSLKLESDSKGQISVHTNSDNLDKVRDDAIALLLSTKEELKSKGKACY